MSDNPEPVAIEDAVRAAAEAKTSELDILRQSLDEAKAKAVEHYDQWLRLRAEFDNFRKRAEKDRADARRWAREELILRLLSFLDVMEQAETAAHQSSDLSAVIQGLDMLYGEFKRFMKDEGLTPLNSAPGEPYRHDQHEAVGAVETDGEEGRVVAVIKKGYTLGDQLLRPAWVTISKQHSGETPQHSPAADDAAGSDRRHDHGENNRD